MITSTIYFTSTYGKNVALTIKQDKHGDYSFIWMKINESSYSSKQIRTALRENILIEYDMQFVDLEEHFMEERHERSHPIDY